LLQKNLKWIESYQSESLKRSGNPQIDSELRNAWLYKHAFLFANEAKHYPIITITFVLNKKIASVSRL
jgi:hypothetical protein